MTDEQILKKAIEKAVKNGWKELDTIHLHPELALYGLGHNEIMAVIFSHDFAKAFWGKPIDHKFQNGECLGCGLKASEWTGCVCGEGWQYHLQQMVLKKEPLKYLERFLS